MKGLVTFSIALLLLTTPLFAAKKEVPKSIPGLKIVSEKEANDLVFGKNCIKEKKCIFVDPRKKKDLKKGIIPGSVLYEFKSLEDFEASKFVEACAKKGYPVKSMADLKNITILSGCNGKFCPRSGALLKALHTVLGGGELLWVREAGVPGMLALRK